jgi:CcmD family protein
MDNWVYLVLAYSAAWFGVLFYILTNANKMAVIEQKIEDLESTIGQKH